MSDQVDSRYLPDTVIVIQQYMLEYIDGTIISIQSICGKVKEKESLIVILEAFKNEMMMSELKKVVDSLIFFVKNDEHYRGNEVVKVLVAIRKGIEDKAKKFIRISERMKQ